MAKATDKQGGSFIPTTPRFKFLFAENSQDQQVAYCRLPECPKVVPRSKGRGRAANFDDEWCMYEFRRRRQALDDLLDRLAEQYRDAPLTSRARNSLEWEIRWLLGVRSAYVSPSEWSRDGLHDPSDEKSLDALEQAVGEWRSSQARTRHSKDKCALCNGTGSTRQLTEQLSHSQGGRRRQHAEHAVQIAAAVGRLGLVVPSLEAVELADAVQQLLLKAYPALPQVRLPTSASRDRQP